MYLNTWARNIHPSDSIQCSAFTSIPPRWDWLLKGVRMNKKIFTALLATMVLSGCASSKFTAPVPVTTSQACWPEVPVKVIADKPEGLTEYRTCQRAKSQAGTPYKIEARLERVATKFCAHEGRHYKLLQERLAFQNFSENARVELVFCCVDDPDKATVAGKASNNKRQIQNEKNKYELLLQVQKLYEAGALSKEEFEAEKKKVLGK